MEDCLDNVDTVDGNQNNKSGDSSNIVVEYDRPELSSQLPAAMDKNDSIKLSNEQEIGKDVKNEQGESEDKMPEFSHELVGSEGKGTRIGLPRELAAHEGKIIRKTRVHEQPEGKSAKQAEINDKNIATEPSHGHAKIENKITTTKPSNEQAENEGRIITTELPQEHAVRNNIPNKLPNEQAETVDKIATKFPHELAASEDKGTRTNHACEIAAHEITADEGKIKISNEKTAVNSKITTKSSHEQATTEPPHEHTKIEDKNATTESSREHAEIKIKNVTTEPPREHKEIKDKNATTEPPHEHIEIEDKNAITEPPHEHAEIKDKHATTEPTHEHAESEDKNTITEPLHEHTETETKNAMIEAPHEHAEITTESSHKCKEIEDKNAVTELPHKQAEAESKKAWQQAFVTLSKITKLFYDVLHDKRQLQALIDEKNEKYEVQFTIAGDFSVNINGKFESELQIDIEHLNQSLKQKAIDNNDAVKKSDQLLAQKTEQSAQLQKINDQLASTGARKSQLKKEIENLSNTVDELNKKINDMQTEIDQNVKAVKVFQNSISKAKSTLKGKPAAREKLCSKKSSIENYQEKNNQNIQRLDQAIKQNEIDLANIKSSISDVEKQHNERQIDMNDNEKIHSEHTEKLHKIEISLIETENNFKINKKQLQLSLEKLETEIEELCNEKSKLQKKFEDNNETILLLNTKLHEHTNNIKKCKEGILKLEMDTAEFQESNDIFISSCKACAKLKIKDMQEKEGLICLNSHLDAWNRQIESLQEELRLLSKKVEEPMQFLKVIEVYSVASVEVLNEAELGYLLSLQSATKNIYVLQATIQHCLCQINLDGLINSFSYVSNESDNFEIHVVDTNHKIVIQLVTRAKEQRERILHICKDIVSNFIKLNNAMVFHKKRVLACIPQQASFWDELQQHMKSFSQHLVDIETKVGTSEITKIIHHGDDGVSKPASLETALDEEELQKLVKLLNEFWCSKNLGSMIDNKLALLNKNNEKLKSLHAAEDTIIAEKREQEYKQVEMHQLEREKQQAQQNLDNVQKRKDDLTTENQQLQEQIEDNEKRLSELTNTLPLLQKDLYLKQSEVGDMETINLKQKEVQDKLRICNETVAKHQVKLESLQLRLQERQLQFKKVKSSSSINDKEAKQLNEKIADTQNTIHTITKKIQGFEKELVQLHEAGGKKTEILKNLLILQEKVNQHQLTMQNLEMSIREMHESLNRNASVIKECLDAEVNHKDKFSDISDKLRQKTIECTKAFVQYIIKVAKQKVVIDYQIEENERKIKELKQIKSSLLSYERTSESKDFAVKQCMFEQQLHCFDHELQEKGKALKIQLDSLQLTQKEIQKNESSNSNISDILKETNRKIDIQAKEKSEIQKKQEIMEVELQESKYIISEELAKCKEALDQLNSKRLKLRGEISDFASQISTLKSKEGDVMKTLKKNQHDKSSLEDKNKKLDLEFKSTINDLVKMDDLITEQSSIIKEHEVKKENLKTAHSRLQKLMDETKGTLKQSEQRKKTALQNSELSISEIIAVNKKKRQAEDALTKTLEEYKESLQQKEELQKEYNEMKTKFHDIQFINQQREELYHTLEELKMQMSEIKENKAEQYTEARSALENMLCTIEHENMHEKNKEEKFKMEKQNLEDGMKTLKNETDRLKEQNDSLGKEFKDLKFRTDSLENVNTDMRNSISKSKVKIQQLEQEIEQLEQEIKQLKSRSLPPRKIKGLQNLGNTCFFNSMLQGVNQVTMLCQLLETEQKMLVQYVVPNPTEGGTDLKVEVQSKPRPFAHALHKFYQEIDSGGYYVAPSTLLHLIGQKNSRFMGRNQQDSHEAFRCLLDGLRMEEIHTVREEIYKKFGTTEQEYRKKLNPEDCKLLRGYLRKANKVTTIVDKVFGGTLINTIVCHQCHDTPQTTEAFLDLSLPITKHKTIDSSMKSITNDDNTLQKHLAKKELKHKSIEDGLNLSLQEFNDLDILDDDNKFICKICTTKLQAKTGKEDDFVLCNVSKSLMIHELPKILVLHIKRFHLEPVVRKDNDFVSFTKNLNMSPYCTTECIEKHEVRYTLFAVVVHSGSLQSGHYTAYVNDKDDKWHYTSDSHISECYNGFKDVEKCQAYMLFYKQNNY